MNSLTFLQNINSSIISLLNLVLFLQLTAACCGGIYRGWTIGEATTDRIDLVGTITAIMFPL